MVLVQTLDYLANVDIASLGAIVQGAVAFDSPENSLPAEEKARYKLYAG